MKAENGKTERRINRREIASWTVVGRWRRGAAPSNGCLPARRERIAKEFRLYEADFYGDGAKPYLHVRSLIQVEGWPAPRLDPGGEFSDDGNVERIASRLIAAGIDVSGLGLS